jgi:4'-phosphopantetheinyl transferase
MPPPEKPSDSSVHLWWAQVNDFDQQTLATLGHNLLPTEELAKCQRLLAPADRHRALLTRIMVRTVLSCYHSLPPWQWQFSTGPEGKPTLANPGLNGEFNLAHSGELILCGYSARNPIGVDIEYLNSKRRVLEIAESFFAETEHQQLSALPRDTAIAAFYSLWTLKEATVKALGKKLPEHLASLVFHRQPNGDYQLAPGEPPASDVRHLVINTAPDYPVAVAMLGESGSLSCEHRRLRPNLIDTLWGV